MTSTASAYDVPTGRCEMLVGSSIRAIPNVHGKARFEPPKLQPIPTATTTTPARTAPPTGQGVLSPSAHRLVPLPRQARRWFG